MTPNQRIPTNTNPKKRAALVLLAALAPILFAPGLASAQAPQPAVSLRATVRPSGPIYTNDQIVFTLEIIRTGGADEVYPDRPEFGDFKVESIQGPNNAVYFASINGVSTTKVIDSYAYKLKAPEKGGQYIVQPVTAKFNGQTIRSNPITIKVQQAASRSKGFFKNAPSPITRPQKRAVDNLVRDRLFLVPEVSAEKCYIREQVRVTWSLYMAESLGREFNVLGYNIGCSPALDEARKDFFVHSIHDWDTHKCTIRTQTVDNEVYHVVKLRDLLLFPQKQGEVKIPEFTAAFSVPDRSGPPSFFMTSPYYKVIVQAPETTLEVLPLPDEGRPANFSGAVGLATLEASTNAKSAKQGDDLFTVSVAMKGRGFVEYFPSPKLASEKDFLVFDKEEAESAQSLKGEELVGVKRWNFVLRADNFGDLEVPPFEISYFNPATEKYETARTEPIPIKVLEDPALSQARRQNALAEAQNANAAATPENDPALAALESDFAYISERDWKQLTLAPRKDIADQTSSLWSLAVALGVYGLTFAARPAKPRDKSKGRRAKAAKKALGTLAGLERSKASDGDFGDELSSAMKGYLADLDNRPPEGLSPGHARELLAEKADDPALGERWFELLEEALAMRYAGGGVERAELLKRARNLVEQTEEAMRKQ